MAHGSLPFRGDHSGPIFNAILERSPLSPVRLNPDLPPRMEDVLNRALEKDRELRYQHASEMRSELLRLKRDSESRATAFTTPGDVATDRVGTGLRPVQAQPGPARDVGTGALARPTQPPVALRTRVSTRPLYPRPAFN